jgi:nucleotide-binding universal stress UspA family protein
MEVIVVGVDESEGARAALRWSVAEAQLRSCSLRAVMCWGYIDQHHGPGQPRAFDPSYDEAAASLALDAIASPILTGTGVDVEQRVVNDLAARGLLEASADADLLVVGARGVGGFGALLLGSVSDHCLHHSTIPVAVVRPTTRAGDRPRRIVVGVDGSDASHRALQWAVDEARLRSASLCVVHAWSVAPVALPFVVDMTGVEEAAKAILDRSLESVDTSDLDPQISRQLTLGGAGPALLDAAEDADLVVVGSRGLGGFKELLLGSVSHRLALHARCPVVVIPEGDVAAAS